MEEGTFPQSLADIDAAFMTAVLGVPVAQALPTAGTEAVHLGQVIKVTVEYASEASSAVAERGLTDTLAVKLGPQQPQLRGFCGLIKALATEHHFYTSDGDRLRQAVQDCSSGVRLARCFSSRVSEDGTQGCLVLEWLPKEQWEMLDVTTGAGEAETSTLVKILASFHAATWSRGDGIVRSSPWVLPVNDAGTKLIFARDVPGVVEKCLENRGSEIPEGVKGLLKDMTNESVSTFFDSLAASEGEDTDEIFVHNDYKMENFLFKKNTSTPEVTLLDWQVLRRAKAAEGAAFELLAFLCRNVRVELLQREGFIASTVDSYLSALTAAAPGASGPTPEQFDDLLRKATVLPLVTLAMTCSKWVEAEVGDDVAARHEQRTRAMFSRCLAVIAHFSNCQ